MDANDLSWRDYERDLRQENKSPNTITNYRYAVMSLAGHWAGRDLLSLAKADISKWLIALGEVRSDSTVLTYFSHVRAFYAWAVREQLVDEHPMATMKAPACQEKPVEIPVTGDISLVLKTIAAEKPRDFRSWRDEAIIRLFCEPGAPRTSAMAALLLDQLDMATDSLTFCDKGGKWRTVPMSARTARAVSRYLRVRPRHPRAGLPYVWLGRRGRMTRDGIYQMNERRCEQAAVARIHPHQYRHFTTNEFLKRGGRERDIMTLNGWSSPAMLGRYAAAAAAERAAAASRELTIGNEL